MEGNQSITIIPSNNNIMDVEKIFHMTGGVGETSYSNNSSLQKKASDKAKETVKEAMEAAYNETRPRSLGIADLGCSSGPNTLSIVREMVDTVESVCRRTSRPSPEFRVYLNDLPTNDFNVVFRALPEFYGEVKMGRSNGGPSLYVAAFPGSFYHRLFPDGSLHFVYSSYSLHWLSKVPQGIYDEQGRSINKRSVYITKSSPVEVREAYSTQFQVDFFSFLRSRSHELITDGRMVLILLGREGHNHVDRGNSLFWELLTRSLSILVNKGEIMEEKLDSYDVHFYAPCKEEVEGVVRKEGSFELERLEITETEKDFGSRMSYGRMVAMAVRAIQESMISHHFGEGILEDLFEHFATLVDEEVAKEDINPLSLVVVLRKL